VLGGKGEERETDLDVLAREGARRMLIEALEMEVANYIDRHRKLRDVWGRAILVGGAGARVRRLRLGAGDVPLTS